RGPDRDQDVEDLDDLRCDEGTEAEVEERADEALVALRLAPATRHMLHARDRRPLRWRRRRTLALLGTVALVALLVALVTLIILTLALPEARLGLVMRLVALVLR